MSNIPATYYIAPIDYHLAMDLVIEHHYLHRKSPCSFAFGLFEINTNKIVGCVVYGTPSSAPLRRGICGASEKDNVLELTRLWVQDDVRRNAESFLIGNTVRLVDKEIIVSYADVSKNHIGYVYQATNWIYTGLSAKRTNWTVKGIELHCQTLADKYTAQEIREKYKEDFSLVDRPRKHRYVFFNCGKYRRRELISKLNYPILPYPKMAIRSIENEQ